MALLAARLTACGSDPPVSDRDAALLAVKRDLSADLGVLVTEVTAMRDAAPAPDADGWADKASNRFPA